MTSKIQSSTNKSVFSKPLSEVARKVTKSSSNSANTKKQLEFTDTRKYETQIVAANLKFKLNKKLSSLNSVKESGKLLLKNHGLEKLKGDNFTPAEVKILTKLTENLSKLERLSARKEKNNKIIKSLNSSMAEIAAARESNIRIDKRVKTLKTSNKILSLHYSAIQRKDKVAVAFFKAMEKTNKTENPLDMNPGDSFRNNLTPESQKIYDATLAKLRNDPRIKFEFSDGAKDNLAFREIALRGLVAATFGNSSDLEERISAGAKASEKGCFTITYVPDSYVDSKGENNWGARSGKTGIIAKQGFTIQQIANKNDNLFIHEFSHTLQANTEGGIELLPPDFGTINTARFLSAFKESALQKYLGQSQIDVETFAKVQNLFRQDPDGLKSASSEMYKLMVDYSGFNPIKGKLVN